MTKVYRSKIDLWLLVIIVGAGIVFVFGALATVVAAIATVPLLACIGILPLLAGIGLPLYFLTSIKYTLSDDRLTVKGPIFSSRIELHQIYRVYPTNNPISSPALSLDRLRIEYGNGKYVMISPDDKEGFLRDLRSRRNFRGAA
jgi:hypothetical protein